MAWMGEPQTSRQYGSTIYDPKHQQLIRSDDKKLTLRPKSLQVFLLLTENAGELIDKEKIIAAVWNNVFVTDDYPVRSSTD